eukprot:4081350-Prymnesium_polylepis.4
MYEGRAEFMSKEDWLWFKRRARAAGKWYIAVRQRTRRAFARGACSTPRYPRTYQRAHSSLPEAEQGGNENGARIA